MASVNAFQNTRINSIGEAGSDIDIKLECFSCHSISTPDLVDQWKVSKHGLDNVKCNVCHGEKTSIDFVAKPNKERCRACHPAQVKTLSESKMSSIACSNCHPIHQFSSMTARETRTCSACHTIQGEMYNRSKMDKKGVQCSNCHFHKEYFSITSHSLKVVRQSCSGCHNGSIIEQAGIIQSEIAQLLVNAEKDHDKQAEINFIVNDGSLGFHNPDKAKEILKMSIEDRTSSYGLLTIFGIVVLAGLASLKMKSRRNKK